MTFYSFGRFLHRARTTSPHSGAGRQSDALLHAGTGRDARLEWGDNRGRAVPLEDREAAASESRLGASTGHPRTDHKRGEQ